MMKRLTVLLAVLALVAAACGGGDSDTTEATTATTVAGPTQGGGATLATVLARGELVCGIDGGTPGFSEPDPTGGAGFVGIDADGCRAVAAAVFGDATKVQFRTVTSAERFDVLKAGDIDVLFRNTTWTASRDTSVNLDFGPTTFYDGQALLGTSAKFSVDSGPADVDGAILCTSAGTTSEKNILEWANLGGATVTIEPVEDIPEAFERFKAGACDLVTTDSSGLVGNMVKAERDGTIAKGDWVVFPAPISKEPLGPAYRQGDSNWGDVVNWSVYAMFVAFEYGLDSTTFVAAVNDTNPELQRLCGQTESGEAIVNALGIQSEGFCPVITQVGSYDEVFDNNLNPIGIFRAGTLNDLWTQGGAIYAPPFR